MVHATAQLRLRRLLPKPGLEFYEDGALERRGGGGVGLIQSVLAHGESPPVLDVTSPG